MEVVKNTVNLIYNEYNITKDLKPYLMSFSYTDYEQEQSDEINFNLKNPDGRFTADWSMEKGAKIEPKINNGAETLDCGKFYLDEITADFDSDSGNTVTIKALATGNNKPVRTLTTRAFDGKTLKQIANVIGENHGFKVIGDNAEITTGREVQQNETDISFLRRISKKYGFIFKITGDTLTFTREKELEKAEAYITITPKDVSNVSFTDTNAKKYSKCTVRYFDAKTKKVKTYTAKDETGLGDETLKINVRCNSVEAAKLIAENGIKNGSKEVTCSISLKGGNPLFMAGVNVELKNFGIYSGKYHIKQSTHNVDNSGAYTTSGEGKRIA